MQIVLGYCQYICFLNEGFRYIRKKSKQRADLFHTLLLCYLSKLVFFFRIPEKSSLPSFGVGVSVAAVIAAVLYAALALHNYGCSKEHNLYLWC